MTRSAFFGNPDQIERVYGKGRREQIAALTATYPTIIDLQNFDEHVPRLAEIEVIFSTWGMPRLSDTHCDRLPALRALFYAAGSVQGFARPFLQRGITVVSAWQANGIPVAEFTLAQILLANKCYFRNTRQCRSHQGRTGGASVGPGNYGETVALLGAGAIGRKLIELLRPFVLDVIVFDPFLPDTEAERLGIRTVTLDEAFARGHVVSNHLANNPQTVKLLRGGLFALMRPNATFINTGRGATVDEEGLISVLRERPDLTALLDVTWPEPPPEGSPLYVLPNVHLSSHIAGSVGDEVVRMADWCIDAFRAWQGGETPPGTVTLSLLETMA